MPNSNLLRRLSCGPVALRHAAAHAPLSSSLKLGLFANVRPGSAVVLEQTRLADGVWLPKFSQINASAKVFLFAGFRLDATREYGNYKRFSTKTGDATVAAPPAKPDN